MDNKYNEFVGISDIYYSIVTDSATGYSATTPVLLAPAASIVNTPNVTSKPTYYSNDAANLYISEGTTEVKMVVPNLPASQMATLLGKYFDDSTGRMYDDGTPNPPKVAIGFKFNKGDDNFRYYWYLKGNCYGGAEEGATKTEDIDIKTYELTFTALSTTYKFTLPDASVSSQKRTIADDTDAAFTGGDVWFSQVQTPLTAVSPSAIALSSTVPADLATAVAATDEVVLTFNNKIAEDYVFVTNTATSAIFATTSAYDTTGKILTLSHASDFATGVKYQVNVIGVKDVYGQSLADSTSTFTVA